MELAKYLDSTFEKNYCPIELRQVGASLAVVPKTKKKKKKQPNAQLFRLYEDWSEQRLMNRASVVGVKGWSSMTREQLIEALRQA